MSFILTQPDIEGIRARKMTSADSVVRKDALLRNLNRFQHRFEADELEASENAPYLTFDESRGDIGIVMETDDDKGEVIGSMWVSFIKAAGFVADDVPEIVTNIHTEWQGKGIGGWLVKQAVHHGRTHGWQGLSLNVEPESPARRLYARNEFIAQNTSGVMLRTLSPLVTSVAVYCGSSDGARPEYIEAASELGRALAKRGITMVYGGASVGLMGAAANACIEAGGTVIGVMPQSLKDLELAHPGITQLEIVDDILARKTRMEELADAFVALPGGMGTLEEVTEVLVRQQLGPYTGPVALYNVEHYWTPLLNALRLMGEEGFIWERYLDAIVVAENLDELFNGFNNWANPGLKWRKGGLNTENVHAEK